MSRGPAHRRATGVGGGPLVKRAALPRVGVGACGARRGRRRRQSNRGSPVLQRQHGASPRVVLAVMFYFVLFISRARCRETAGSAVRFMLSVQVAIGSSSPQCCSSSDSWQLGSTASRCPRAAVSSRSVLALRGQRGLLLTRSGGAVFRSLESARVAARGIRPRVQCPPSYASVPGGPAARHGGTEEQRRPLHHGRLSLRVFRSCFF